jgi:hypothetical protein
MTKAIKEGIALTVGKMNILPFDKKVCISLLIFIINSYKCHIKHALN